MRVIVVRLRSLPRPGKPATIALLLSGLLLGLLLTFALAYPRSATDISGEYRYDRRTAPNGIVLHTIETTPEHIRLQAIDTNVTGTPYYGINGGFFWEGSLLSIAVVNDKPLKGLAGDYGSGWYNTGVNGHLRRGTLVWDEAAGRFSVQIVQEADELVVTDKARYWAQGGVSMKLDNEAMRQPTMIAEEMPAYDEARMRSGLVYDRANRLYMVVTPTRCTVEQFRSAIVALLGDRQLVDGILLDGDGSSQLQTKRAHLAGDNRQVYQMLTIR
ncbi:hypothetical protein ACFFNY_18355 [Paenibacillus hodogayensis]|uniref:Phosphodiester glycosidase domain-containing protein n=1 Tax=Paenibacillus hodogayensis TaxID=279208 RepID=A0ABV5VZP1_9BACL